MMADPLDVAGEIFRRGRVRRKPGGQPGEGCRRIAARMGQAELPALAPHRELIVGVERKDDECLGRSGHCHHGSKTPPSVNCRDMARPHGDDAAL